MSLHAITAVTAELLDQRNHNIQKATPKQFNVPRTIHKDTARATVAVRTVGLALDTAKESLINSVHENGKRFVYVNQKKFLYVKSSHGLT